jgi:transposase
MKESTLRAAEQDRADIAQARAIWRADTAGVGGIAPQRLVFLEEGGGLTNMARRYGRSPPGQRAWASLPFGHGKRLSGLGTIGMDGIIAAMAVEAATDGVTFTAYLQQVLLPELRKRKPAAVLVMDNLRAHKTAQVQAVLDRSAFAYRYLPSCSPDLNPIEPAWAKVKSDLRRVAARTTDALHHALGPALDSVTAQDAAGYFRHRGYTCLN